MITKNCFRRGGSRRITWVSLFVGLMTVVATFHSYAQSVDDDVALYIARIAKGQVEEARRALPDLVTKYPNNAGVIFLQSKLATNGVEAIRMYQSVVDNFPKSDWADDALFAIHQYYYALGLYRTADLKMQELRSEYPTSRFITQKPDLAAQNQDLERVNLPGQQESVPGDTVQVGVDVPVVGIPTVATDPYTLQTGAFSTLKNAEKQKELLEAIGLTVEITNKVRGGRSLYLVWAGSFSTADQAKSAGRDILKKQKINFLVVEKF